MSRSLSFSDKVYSTKLGRHSNSQCSTRYRAAIDTLLRVQHSRNARDILSLGISINTKVSCFRSGVDFCRGESCITLTRRCVPRGVVASIVATSVSKIADSSVRTSESNRFSRCTSHVWYLEKKLK